MTWIGNGYLGRYNNNSAQLFAERKWRQTR
jgi:hypothetical protein